MLAIRRGEFILALGDAAAWSLAARTQHLQFGKCDGTVGRSNLHC